MSNLTWLQCMYQHLKQMYIIIINVLLHRQVGRRSMYMTIWVINMSSDSPWQQWDFMSSTRRKWCINSPPLSKPIDNHSCVIITCAIFTSFLTADRELHKSENPQLLTDSWLIQLTTDSRQNYETCISDNIICFTYIFQIYARMFGTWSFTSLMNTASIESSV